MINLDRNYSSKGLISAGSGIYVYDDDLGRYILLIPTSDMPSETAPETIENPLLTVSVNGQIEGKQTMEQKEFTFNWNRDNQRRLAKYSGKQVKLLERDGMEFTGRLYKGTIAYGKDAQSDNVIMNGKLWITVNEDLGPVDDARDMIALTSVITSALVTDVKIAGTGTFEQVVETTDGGHVTATSEAPSVCSASITSGKLTITGVAKGYTIVKLVCTADGEGSSERTIMVEVIEA